MVRTQIYLPQNQLVRLKQIAYQQNTSLSEIIRKFIKDRLVEENTEKKKKSKFKNAGDVLLYLAKKAKKEKWRGPKDLASNVDKYLYGGI